jgi:predicted AlkP superfamily pyrophosphatase or phosphodiesterase
MAFAPADLRPTVILISIDGWRWDYQKRVPAPNLRRLSVRGLRAAGLIPSFPTKTFPNHYTLVTGLYPGHHGIVGNTLLDPTTGRAFAMWKREEVRDAMWWGGEPIWVTASRNGQIAAPMFWPGSEAPIGGDYPRYFMPYDVRMPGNDRVDQVLKWLDLPASERPTLLTLYFNEVDDAGHLNGPNSGEVREAAARVDTYLGRLVRGLESRKMLDQVNIMVVSDHGMAETSQDRVIFVDDYVELASVQIVDMNPTLMLIPKPGREDEVYRRLKSAHRHLRVYRREESPPHWHYRDHARITPIVGVADEGWVVILRSGFKEYWARNLRGIGGLHGYDPQVKSMQGLFVATGPAFPQHAEAPAFENVNVYDLLCDLLQVEPAQNDGDPAVARSLLSH